MHLSGNVVSLKAFAPDVSDQTAYAVAKAMARYPEDRYESYAAFIEQLEDAKRRITDPEFREKLSKEKPVEIISTQTGSRYGLYLIIGMVFIVGRRRGPADLEGAVAPAHGPGRARGVE